MRYNPAFLIVVVFSLLLLTSSNTDAAIIKSTPSIFTTYCNGATCDSFCSSVSQCGISFNISASNSSSVTGSCPINQTVQNITSGGLMCVPLIPGPKGDKGDQGMQGTPGSNGGTGPQGPPGADGANGLNGTNGINGTAPTSYPYANLTGVPTIPTSMNASNITNPPWVDVGDANQTLVACQNITGSVSNLCTIVSSPNTANVSSQFPVVSYLALWSNNSILNTSVVFQDAGGDIGIDTPYPLGQLDVMNGLDPLYGILNGQGKRDEVVNFNGPIGSPFISIGRCQNFLLNSEAFDTVWIKANTTVVANGMYSPLGTFAAETIYGNISGSVYQAYTNITADNFTFSVYLKGVAGNESVGLRISSNSSVGIVQNFTISTKWARYSVTQDMLANVSTANRTVYIYHNNRTIYAWGAQLEFGQYASPYCGLITTGPIYTLYTGIRTTMPINTTGAINGGAIVGTSIVSTGGVTGTSMTSSGGVACGGAVTGATTLAMSSWLAGATTISATSNINTTQAPGLISTDGYIAQSPTAATAASPIQNSPRVRLSGTVWDFDAAASRTIDWKQEAVPIVGGQFGPSQGSSSRLSWGYGYSDLSNTGFSERMVLSSEGSLDVLGQTFGLQVLVNGTNVSLGNWQATGGFNLTAPGTWANYSFAKGASGILWQNIANFTNATNVNRWYVFNYSVTNQQAGCIAYITPSFASKYIYLPGVATSNGSFQMIFKSNVSITNFTLNVTCTAGGVGLGNLSLKEYQSGDIVANGAFTGGGTNGLKIDGNGTISVTGMLNLNRSTYSPCTVTQEGMMVYNSTAKRFYGCNSTNWTPLDNNI